MISVSLGKLKRKDELKRRTDEAARYAPLDQLRPSPQCGFLSTVHRNLSAVKDRRHKPALVVEVAREV